MSVTKQFVKSRNLILPQIASEDLFDIVVTYTEYGIYTGAKSKTNSYEIGAQKT
ncbi:hypothetical protein LEP1GSC043_3628 [Leptospira weilii str. Ecochallenge]|uniref:Uncharacterized protein n=1 Tax=Leptospira weilii str. Ecochallenge TaxID=1049986 RepID=N1U819_9LEPT|nr:hypothetical protein LEP1GSC043_3628 [Leptospira weilii str. Ecochallenge]